MQKLNSSTTSDEDDAYDKEGDLKEKNQTIKDVTEAIQEIMLGEDQNEGR